ncbi:MAG: hypothetical protein VB858_05860 [Planctomycetaceae bacterium]
MSGTFTSVNRRTVLSLATSLAFVSPGCSMLTVPPEEPDTAPPEKKPKKQSGTATRRLFAITLTETSPQTQLAIQAQCQELSNQARQAGDMLKPWGPAVTGNALSLIGWLTPVTAAAFRKLETVRQVEAYKPGIPVESTIAPLRRQLTEPAPDGKRNLIVILGPNSWPASLDLTGVQTAEKIAKLWSETLQPSGAVSISAIQSAQWSEINGAGFHIGPVPGQIRVTVEGTSVPDVVLQTIQSHPQVERLQWDHAEVIYNCPPCGMG